MKAAEQGLAEARYNLGVFYQDGIGVGVDKKWALHWLSEAIVSYEASGAPPKDLHQRYLQLQQEGQTD